MTKLIRISLLVVLVFVIAFGLIAAAKGAGPLAAGPSIKGLAYVLPGGDAEPNVGWNTKPTAMVLPGIHPCIGWNT